jgi:Cu+-exporting ATPase
MITVQKVIDPVCGREVDTSSRFNSYYMGHPYYFCSVEDKLAFDKEPRKYLMKNKTQGEGSR